MKFSEALSMAIESLRGLGGDSDAIKKLCIIRGLAKAGRVYVHNAPRMIERCVEESGKEVPEFARES